MRAIFVAIAFVASLGWTMDARAQGPGDGGADVWDLSAPNAPRHWFSGLRCWESAGNARFERRIAFADSGFDVGCTYEGEDVSVTVYSTFRPGDAALAPLIAQTRAQISNRYTGARVASDTQRTIRTSAGEVALDEYILSVNGEDSVQRRSMRGATGAWHADVGGWTLKVRISSYGRANIDAMQTLADALIGRAYAEMQTARDCAAVGRSEAPNLRITPDESVAVQVNVGLIGVALAETIPANPEAARRAGFVCLGDVAAARDGRLALSTLPLTPAPPDAGMTQTILALGEVHGGETQMIAIVDMSMNPFGVPDLRADRGHFAFGRSGDETAFYGALDGGAPRQTGARVAIYAVEGGAPLITVSARPSE